ncbi:MAG TPA: TadE/TadG family type IV pilus assembly protein [Sphingomonas sp.]
MSSRTNGIRALAARLIRSKRALGAVEFALTAPFLILIYVGSYQLMDAISAYRKVTVTARSLADLATQNETTTPAYVQEILNGSRQVMTPYSTASAGLVIAQIAIDHNGTPSLVWVCVNGATPLCSTSNPKLKITDIDLPNDLKVPDTFTMYSQIVFNYTPAVASSLIGPITFSDHIFMNPRRSPSVCLNVGTDSTPDCLGQDASS